MKCKCKCACAKDVLLRMRVLSGVFLRCTFDALMHAELLLATNETKDGALWHKKVHHGAVDGLKGKR